MKVSVKDISKKTGFSPATISNALNHKRGVSEETAAKVLQAAKEMGYISESRIMKVKLVIFKRNGLIINDTPFFSLMIDGIENECRAAGMEMVLSYLNKNDENYEQQVEWLIHDNSSAVILLGTELMEEDVEIYKSATCPFLMLDYWAWDMRFNGVLINNADSARLAVEYLIQKGHKEIGYLRGSYRIKAFRSREVGYATALRKSGLTVRKEYAVTLSTTMNGAYKDMI
ncbi:MAG TPA: LacI family DNA-binding transcriptional regulator, partial [Candidatus Blautia stercoravium]|nr:LacI family DNA-binding transcriptional regulator [Candidatus Blautia stercoravium]